MRQRLLSQSRVRLAASSFGLILFFQNFAGADVGPMTGAQPCSSAKIQEILAVATPQAATVKVDCSVKLSARDVVTKGIVIEGEKSSGVQIDCNGAKLIKNAASGSQYRILVASKKEGPNWSVPRKISVSSCHITGTVRIRGLGNNGEAPGVRESSVLDKDHTVRAQAAAPRQIVFENSTFVAEGGIPFYVAPGVTEVTVQGSQFLGKSNKVAIYLDAESARNRILDNKFDLGTTRELIAVDGSAQNIIERNQFLPRKQAAIYIYRNCGEGGTVRHQAPQNNLIRHNFFYSDVIESIYVGSRHGIGEYCSFDAGHPFGSSKDNRDFADNNRIEQNQFVVNQTRKSKYISRYVILTSSKTTKLQKNHISIGSDENRPFNERVFGTFEDLGGNSIKKIPPQSSSKVRQNLLAQV